MDWCKESTTWLPQLDATCAMLLMKFGHVEYKVEPILDQHLWVIQQACDYTKEEDIKRLVEVFMTRHFNHRNITWAYAVVQDCQFYLFTFEGNFELHMDFMVQKIKREIDIAHK